MMITEIASSRSFGGWTKMFFVLEGVIVLYILHSQNFQQ